MAYFDDIRFINGKIHERCVVKTDSGFPESWSLEFMASGRIYYGVNHEPTEILDKPIIFWHRPDFNYQYGPVDEFGWHHHWFLMSGPRARRVIEEGFELIGENGYAYVRHPKVFLELFQSLIALIQEGNPINQGRMVMTLERIYLTALEETIGCSNMKQSNSLAPALRRIEQDPFSISDLHELAALCHLSYSHFRALFRKQIGRSPHDYILFRRMREAACMLDDPDRRIQDVAYECGYDDPAQFTRLFKSKIGLSPKRYRDSIPSG